jgi:hypothetical protein
MNTQIRLVDLIIPLVLIKDRLEGKYIITSLTHLRVSQIVEIFIRFNYYY